ncbi:hypothetical protein GALMADRAFT_217539 [Galerina marginata CBS 339.88]|uniref:Uncharacterized protein n=1 Tax=Galerina marginata (strain CBS 339.88) TaxID=685588 RepID=A0A067S3Y6_GALM3|nr:hypothetical protein GALMADRAFT_217539 [Galerina marginata CBS 339.88]
MPSKRKVPDDFRKPEKPTKNNREDQSSDGEREDSPPASTKMKLVKKRRGRPPGKRQMRDEESADDSEHEDSDDGEPPVKCSLTSAASSWLTSQKPGCCCASIYYGSEGYAHLCTSNGQCSLCSSLTLFFDRAPLTVAPAKRPSRRKVTAAIQPAPVSLAMKPRPTSRRPSPGYKKLASEDEGYSVASTKAWQRGYHSDRDSKVQAAFTKAHKQANALKRRHSRKTRLARHEDQDGDEDKDDEEEEEEEANDEADEGQGYHGGRRDGGPDKDHEGGNRETNDTNHDEGGTNDGDENGQAGFRSSREGGYPPRAPSVDVFSAVPLTKPTKFVRGLLGNPDKSPPLESESSGSDFEETELAAKRTRAFRNRRSMSVDEYGQDDEDDSVLQAEVVQSSVPVAEEDIGAEHIPSSPALPDDASYVDKPAVKRKENGRVPPADGIPSNNEPIVDGRALEPKGKARASCSGGIQGDEEPSADGLPDGPIRKGRVGRPSKAKQAEVEAFGMRCVADGQEVALRLGLTLESLFEDSTLKPVMKRAPNPWNHHQAVEARLDRVPGEGREAFHKRAHALYLEKIDPEKHTEEEITAYKKSLAENLEAMAMQPGALKAPVSRLTDNITEMKTAMTILARYNPDIHNLNFALYTGTDQAARQISGIVTGSQLVLDMINEPENNIMVQELIDMFTGILSARIGKAKLAAAMNKGQGGDSLIDGEPALTTMKEDKKGKKRADRPSTELQNLKIVPIKKGADSAVAFDFRNVFTMRLLNMMNTIISGISTSSIRTTMTWTKFGTVALGFSLRIVSWPHELLHVPGRYFDCSRMGLNDWKHLCELSSDGVLKVEEWTPVEKKLTPGSVAYGEIPLVVNDEGVTLLFAKDVQANEKKPAVRAGLKSRVPAKTPFLSPALPLPHAHQPKASEKTMATKTLPPPSSHRVGHSRESGADDFMGYQIVDQPTEGKDLCRLEEPDIVVLRQQAAAYEREIETSHRGDMGRYAYRHLAVPLTDRPFLMAPGVPPPSQLPPNAFYEQLMKPPSSRSLPPHHPAVRVQPNANIHRAPSLAQSWAHPRSLSGPMPGQVPNNPSALTESQAAHAFSHQLTYAPYSRSTSNPTMIASQSKQPVAESSRMAQARVPHYQDDYMDEDEAQALARYQYDSEV